MSIRTPPPAPRQPSRFTAALLANLLGLLVALAGVGLGLWTAYDINHQVGNLVLAGLLVVGGLYAATLPDEG